MLSQEFVRAIHQDRQREIEAALRMRELRTALESARAASRSSQAGAAPAGSVAQPRQATGAGA